MNDWNCFTVGDPQQESGAGSRVAQEHGGPGQDFDQDGDDEAARGPEEEGGDDDGGGDQDEQRFVLYIVQLSTVLKDS